MQLQNRLDPLGLVGGREAAKGRDDRPLDVQGSELTPPEFRVVAKVHVWLGLVAEVLEAQQLVAVLKWEFAFMSYHLVTPLTWAGGRGQVDRLVGSGYT